MPKLNAVNEELRRRMQRRFGAWLRLRDLYPGLQKMVQAAGRVACTDRDTGLVVLMDDCLHPKVMQLLQGGGSAMR